MTLKISSGRVRMLGAAHTLASRVLAESADIVFCPYNYIIDPIIRANMRIGLKVRSTPQPVSAECP